ncbi:MAG: methionyl-tRNA formyltransferase [Candidatus Pelagibacter sp.]|nr:methionyl-tRNA formyltransferase [Candidatus Pelagibacter sp.]OUW67914.1 MAG: methionyl-tRNA formyltransferase [Candidatus Pelagibacter sp. TMED202]
MSLKIVFMGTPEFSIPALKVLKQSKHKIVCVYTQPPKKKSRGQKILKTAVHVFSENEGIKVKTNKLSDENEYKNFIKLNPDLVVVVAYGQIIPDIYLNNPDFIFLNLHASLLPKWRGAAPIERAILNKDKETGISIMKIEKKLDAGPFIKQVTVKIYKETTSGELNKKLSVLGAQALKESIELISSNKVNYNQQNEKDATYAKKINKIETRINWKDKAENIIAKINAFNPKPGAWFLFKNERIKILKAKEINQKGGEGKVLDDKLTVGCSANAIQILKLKKEGKREMDTQEFLIGNALEKGTTLN